MNRVVAHYKDGRLLKGLTNDFLPTRDHFHVQLDPGESGARPVDVKVPELKALFFVKDYSGDPSHQRTQDFDPAKPPVGRKIQVVFQDGEVMVGTTQGYRPDRPGFFVTPADEGNNERCFVITAATQEVKLL